MNKYWFAVICMIWLIFIAVLVGSLASSTISATDPNVIQNIGGNFNEELTTLNFNRILGVFWHLLTFRIDGVPAIVTIFLVFPAVAYLAYVLIELVIKVIDAIIPF
jgi:hypothetical protein